MNYRHILFVMMIAMAAFASHAVDRRSYESVTADSIHMADTLSLDQFNPYIPKQLYFSFQAKIDSNFTYLEIGQPNAYIRINSDLILLDAPNSSGEMNIIQSFKHNITITDSIKLSVHLVGLNNSTESYYADVEVKTGNQTYTTRFDRRWFSHSGIISARIGFAGSNATLRATSYDFDCPVWMIGDSYFGINNNRRWPYHIRHQGYFNFFIEGLGGASSYAMYNELTRALKHGTPKYLVWCLGMNDRDHDTITPNKSWLNHLNKIKEICEEKDITLILATIPNVPTRINTAKNAVVRESGYRYIDFAKAVGAEETGSQWFDGMLHADGVPPQESGAKALAQQVLIDFPELMTLAKDIVSGDINGDGEHDITDVNIAINIMLGKSGITDWKGNADVNEDRTIDITDTNLIINQLLKGNN